MAFSSGHKSRASIGLLNASGYTRNWSTSQETDMLDVTTIADVPKQFIPGQTGSNLSFDMILEVVAGTNSQYDVLKTWKAATATPVDIAPQGYSTGSPVWMVNAIETQVSTSAEQAGTVDCSVSAIGDGQDDWGISVEDYTAITGDTTGTARDSGIVGGTANGGVAHIHVTAFSGFTSDVVIIEHSVDGVSAWATLVTFATVTGLTSQRVAVAAGTTVRKFLRVSDDVTGSGSVTRQVSFARR